MAKGIGAHKVFKLGKESARRDSRNLKFASLVIARRPAPPASYDFDSTHRGIPTPMFANDVYGCCVISGRAHQTLRFEDIEQGSVLMIKDKEVVKEYLAETGGEDKGLVVLDSLKLWRKAGWKVGQHRYKIRAFAELDPKDPEQVRTAIYADVGLGLGLLLPLSAQDQIQAGQPWELVAGPRSKIGSWGGHYAYACGYTPKGPVCVTWGRKQQMSWDWLKKYADEAYAIFDEKDSFLKSAISGKRIAEFLDGLGSGGDW